MKRNRRFVGLDTAGESRGGMDSISGSGVESHKISMGAAQGAGRPGTRFVRLV